jgi:hypothetical protein
LLFESSPLPFALCLPLFILKKTGSGCKKDSFISQKILEYAFNDVLIVDANILNLVGVAQVRTTGENRYAGHTVGYRRPQHMREMSNAV